MNHLSLFSRRSWQHIYLLSIVIVLAAQLNIDLFNSNFKISIAVICFPVFFILLDDFRILPVTICSALGVFLSRILVLFLRQENFFESISTALPELCFYLFYGILMYIYQHLSTKSKTQKSILIPVFLMDYASNFLELLLRFHLDAFELRTQLSILLVALLRATFVFIVLSIFNRYRLTLLNREHADRYERLMVLISKLNGEVIWMQKNTSLIEETMSTSYQLSQQLQESSPSSSLSSFALQIARDVHEIKKEYYLIMRGLSEALHTEFQDEGMYLISILNLLSKTAQTEAQSHNKKVEIQINCSNDLYSDRHYALMSVFHNLITNALEASAALLCHIQIVQTESKDTYLFQVIDNGPGIAPEDKELIFDAGFSTKINYETGTVNRGLGLNIVKNIVEQQLNGNISLESTPLQTVFSIHIPKTELEVKAQ